MVKHKKVSKYYKHDSRFTLDDNFPMIFGDIKSIWRFKTSVRFTLKELRCELSSSFDIISDPEKGGILFLQIAVIFEIKKKNDSKRKHRVPDFFINKKKKDHSTI